MDFFIACEWLGTAVSLTGALTVAMGKRIGFWIFMLSDILLSIYAIHLGAWGLVTLYAAFGLINIIGIVRKPKIVSA